LRQKHREARAVGFYPVKGRSSLIGAARREPDGMRAPDPAAEPYRGVRRAPRVVAHAPVRLDASSVPR